MHTLTRTLAPDVAASAGPERTALFLALECSRPRVRPQAIALEGVTEVEIGRGDDRRVLRHGDGVRVEVPDAWMSTRHCALRRGADGWAVEDLGSKNGTLVNGAAATGELADRDVVCAGATLFLFRVTEPAPDVELPGPLDTLCAPLARELETLCRVATADVPILLRGESGTGKEVFARAVHELSGRAGKFVAVNCGALPEGLVEGELFGARKGAFSGAVADRAGLVRTADRGTLFLDEIAELPEPSQAALLRVLQEGEVVPLGGAQPIPVSIRVVAATHQDLEQRVADGRFREDLFARLLGYQLILPPLRERVEDLGLLAGRLLERIAGDHEVRFHPEAGRALFEHRWPLNVRELERALATAIAVATGPEIRLEHLPEAVRTPAAGGAPIRERIDTLLGEHDGNVSAVARALGTSRSQVRRLAARHNIDLDRHRR